eukprot:964170-Pelagomonas_calceolata.AAC.1
MRTDLRKQVWVYPCVSGSYSRVEITDHSICTESPKPKLCEPLPAQEHNHNSSFVGLVQLLRTDCDARETLSRMDLEFYHPVPVRCGGIRGTMLWVNGAVLFKKEGDEVGQARIHCRGEFALALVYYRSSSLKRSLLCTQALLTGTQFEILAGKGSNKKW